MLIKMNLVAILVSSSLALPLPEDQRLPTTLEKLPNLPQKLPSSSPRMLVTSQKVPNSIPTTSPLPPGLKTVKLHKKQNTENKEAANSKGFKKTRNGHKRGETASRRRRRSRRTGIPICMMRCLILGLLHPAQCHALCS